MSRSFFALCLLVLAGSAGAQSLFVEGQHYTSLEQPQPTESAEVMEFFSYGCPHCFEFEDSLGPWVAKLPDSVRFERVPAGLGRRFFQLMALMYHVADSLEVSEQIHPVLFDEIHNKKNNTIGSVDVLASLFEQHAGVTREQFEQAANSPAVIAAFQRTEGMQGTYGLRGVPMLVVNGKYQITRNTHVTSYPQMLEIADYLLAQDQAASR